MRNLKRILALVLCVVMTAISYSGCGGVQKDDKIKIIATVFPVYDWVREVIGNNTEDLEASLLLDKGVDMHSFQPTAEDMVKIADCDVFVYVGGESDRWIEDALTEAVNKDMVAINLMEVLGDKVKSESTVEGMEKTSDEEEDDEHIWLSLRNAEYLCDYICDKICQLDNKNQPKLKKNTEAYSEKLNAVDLEYKNAVKAGKTDTLIFGDRFPFRYMVDDYNLKYFAAFPGCSAETEASFETVAFLADKVDELGLEYVLETETSQGKLARTIIENTNNKNQEVLVMNSIQGVSSEDIENGATYLEIMKDNLRVLEKALG